MDDLGGMAIFAKVVEEKSFSGAARKLGISTPVVSKRVTELERRLGARLLNRTTRRLSLTQAGAAFYSHCARIVEEARDAELAVTNLDEIPRGHLRISAPTAFGTLQLAPVTKPFLSRYPEITLEITVSDHLADLAADGIDLAIRVTSTPHESLVARKIASSSRVVCAAPAYWNHYGRPARPTELLSHDCLLYGADRLPDEWSFKGPNGTETVPIDGRLRINSMQAMAEAAIAGFGVLMCPSYLVSRDIQDGRLERVLTEYVTPRSDIYAVYLPNRFLSKKARAFIDFLVDWYREFPLDPRVP